MIPRQDLPSSLIHLAALQDDVLSREQVLAHGVSRHVLARLLADRRWRSLGCALYLIRDVEPSWRSLAWAGVLAGGDRARVGGSAAAHLFELEPTAPKSIDIWVPSTSHPRAGHAWRFRRERAGVRRPESPGSPPRTGIEDTVLDLCDGATEIETIDWVSAAVRRRLTTTARLARRLDQRPQLRGRRTLITLLDDVGGGIESPLEWRYLHDVERAHGLPRADRQIRRGRYRSDVDYGPYALLVELDGRLGHDGSGRFRDMWRDNEFVLAGRPTLRYGWHDVASASCEIAHQVGSVLSSRGWNGLPHPCPRCCRSDLWTV